MRLMAQAKAREEPPMLRRRVWRLRWISLGVCFNKGFDSVLLDLRSNGEDGVVPPAHEVVNEFRHAGLTSQFLLQCRDFPHSFRAHKKKGDKMERKKEEKREREKGRKNQREKCGKKLKYRREVEGEEENKKRRNKKKLGKMRKQKGRKKKWIKGFKPEWVHSVRSVVSISHVDDTRRKQIKRDKIAACMT